MAPDESDKAGDRGVVTPPAAGGLPVVLTLSADATDRVAEIWRDGLDVWLSIGRRWYGRSRAKATWSPEDVVGDSNDAFEHVTPLAERSIDLAIELLRPWARAFEERRP